MNDYRCQHCNAPYPPAEWMYHKASCPHGKIDPERLGLIPDWKLEEELLRRKSPHVFTEAVTNGDVMKLATCLSDCLVLLRKIQSLTRYVRSNTTVMNLRNGMVCELDRILSDRGYPPPETDHAD